MAATTRGGNGRKRKTGKREKLRTKQNIFKGNLRQLKSKEKIVEIKKKIQNLFTLH